MVINPPSGYPLTDYNFHWDFGDGSSINTNTPSHIYNIQGTYTVSLIVYDNVTSAAVCSSSTSFTVTFCDTHFEQDTLSPANFNFWATLTMGNTAVWNFGDGNTSTSDSVAHTYTNPGTYTVNFTQLDPSGNTICVDSFMVAYDPSNTCSFNVSTPFSNPASLALHALVPSSEGTIMWDYDNGTGSQPGALYTNVAYGDSGYRNICMYYTNGSYSCQHCEQIYVNPNINCAFTNVSDMFDMNLMHFTSTNITSGNQYVWNFGDGSPLITTYSDTISHYYPVGGFYYVCMEVKDGLGNTLCSYCNYVAANVMGYHCNANFTSVSVGLMGYFINQASSSMPSPVTYTWDFGDGYTSSVPYPQHQYAAAGDYTVCLNVSTPGWGCNDTYCDTIHIDSTIVNPTGCSAYFVFTQTASYQVIGVNLSSGFNISYSWDFGDGSVASSAYPSHQYANVGTYVVCLTVADQSGCSSTYCDSLTVDANGNISYRGLNLGFVLNIVSTLQITGINKPEEEQPLQIYPVPARDFIYTNLDLKGNSEQAYEVLGTEGNKVMSGVLSKNNSKLNISKLAKGMYLLRMLNADGSATGKTFIKQ